MPRPSYLAARSVGLLLAVLLILGTWLRIRGLDARPVWVDEAFSVLYATIPWSEIIELRRTGTNPPLYHFLLWGWVALFGDSTPAIRSLSVVFSLTSVALLYAVARRLAGLPVACIAAGLLAVSNLSIAYAQEARFYALTQMLSLLASLLLCRLIDRVRLRDAAWYALSMSALVWAHTYGWFVLAAHAVWLAAALRETPPGDQRRRQLLLGTASFAAVILSFVPWLPILYQQVGTVLGHYWISEPSWSALAICFREMLVLDGWLRWPLAALVAAALLGQAVRLLRATARRPTRRDAERPEPLAARQPPGIRSCHLWGLVGWTTLPILIPFAWSKFSTPIFQVKYAIVAQAPAVILWAVLVARRPVLGLAVLAVLAGFWSPNADRGLVVEDFPGATRVLLEQTDETDTIFVYRDYAFFALNYYLKSQRQVVPVYSEGLTTDSFAPYYHGRAVTYDTFMDRLAHSQAQDLWLVLRWGSSRQRRETMAQVSQHRTIESIWPLRSVDVIQLRRR
jgi:hypothetical protein